MTNFIINEQFLDNEIMHLLVENEFSEEDIGTVCYKEVIKYAVCKLIEYFNYDDSTMLHGSLLSSMCLLDSDFYREVYEEIIDKKLFNIGSIEGLHALIKEALPKNSMSFNVKTYMMKANALAYLMVGRVRKINNCLEKKESIDSEGIILDNKIMTILKAYGFEQDSLGTFCYKEVIKEVIICLSSNFDNLSAVIEILQEDIMNLYSSFYMNVWNRIFSMIEVKKIECVSKRYEFNFAQMHRVIKESLYNSDLILKLKDDDYMKVLFDNISEIVTKIIGELESDKTIGFSMIKKIDRVI